MYTPRALIVDGPQLRNELFPDYDCPRGYIAHVYQILYGEDECDTAPIENKNGNEQFCQMLSAFAHGYNYVESSQFEDEILKKGTASLEQHLQHKMNVLKKLQSNGVWLVDTMIFG